MCCWMQDYNDTYKCNTYVFIKSPTSVLFINAKKKKLKTYVFAYNQL